MKHRVEKENDGATDLMFRLDSSVATGRRNAVWYCAVLALFWLLNLLFYIILYGTLHFA